MEAAQLTVTGTEYKPDKYWKRCVQSSVAKPNGYISLDSTGLNDLLQSFSLRRKEKSIWALLEDFKLLLAVTQIQVHRNTTLPGSRSVNTNQKLPHFFTRWATRAIYIPDL